MYFPQKRSIKIGDTTITNENERFANSIKINSLKFNFNKVCFFLSCKGKMSNGLFLF